MAANDSSHAAGKTAEPPANDQEAGNRQPRDPPSAAANSSPPAPAPSQANGEADKTKRDDDGKQRNGRQTTGGSDGARRHATDLKDKITDKKERIKDKNNPPGGFDSTPLPTFPPGYTVKFTFHKASNLPAADLHDASADPFIKATLTAAVPKRHKEDPIMVHRTRTIRGCTDPEWEEEWIVANIPSSGFKLKCRIYDEDYPDHDDRLGNVTVTSSHVDENWKGLDHKVFDVKKRMGSKRAYFFKAASTAMSKHGSMTPRLELSIQVVGKSDPPGAQMYTVGPTTWVKHFSPMIGRITGIKVNRDERRDDTASKHPQDKQTKKYE